MKPHFGRVALRDLRSIYRDSVERWGEPQAQRYAALIWRAIEEITDRPERCRLRDDVYPGCRIRFVGRHAILYRIRNEQVQVARVLHARMDYQQHLPPDFLGE